MPRFLAEVLVVVGALVLVAAMVPLGAALARLPSEENRVRWKAVQRIMLAYIVGFCTYLVVFWERHRVWWDLVAPATMFVTALFIKSVVTAVREGTAEARDVARPDQHQGVTDALVGVYNRRYLEHRLAEEVARARRHAVPLSVLLFDIDHFRKVNQKRGREVGDRVLSYLGHLLVTGVRESDVVARYGGEELLVIAPATEAGQAVVLADRLRQAIEAENLSFGGEAGSEPDVQVTVSVGIGELQPDEAEWGRMVERAEAAVIEAKLSGRNRVAA
jgi:diguanylate cyclase (GGDEF)-like protein